ncbi:hypothetical protein CLG96_15110 [Sphingomonas oleivorans]|uniref:Lipoprotein n=1 Tax=Sphingomonas oleivorans TaxID=1735121 RepID=A0A2T5FUX8_9SPHN|nr:hypothetical protein [Sphingomonas oleivorans]PTQ08531.1 hypothetical protein CLG96_15110 [Sphingomonas oleivorans]
MKLALLLAPLMLLAACSEEAPELTTNRIAPANIVDPAEEEVPDTSDFGNVASADIPALAEARREFKGDLTDEELRPALDTVLIRHHIQPSEQSYADLANMLVALRKATEVNGIASFSEIRVLRCMKGRRPWPEGTSLQTTADSCIIRLQEPSEFVKIPTSEIETLGTAAKGFKGDVTPDALRAALDGVLIRHGRRLSERSYSNLSKKLISLRKKAEAEGRTDISEMGLLACMRMADVGPVETSLSDAATRCADGTPQEGKAAIALPRAVP